MDYETTVERKLLEILSGKMTPEKMPGSTSESAALALVLGQPKGLTSLGRLDCWRYLRDQDAALVRRLCIEHADAIQEWEHDRRSWS